MSTTVSNILQQLFDDSGQTEKVAGQAALDAAPVVSEHEKLATELNLSPEEIDAAVKELDNIEKHAEAEKTAEEAELTGRFMARGFYDELNKLGMQVGDPAVNKGGGKAVAQQADASCPQDGSAVLAKIKSAVEGTHVPASPTKSEDTMDVVKKIVQSAQAVKAPNAVATPTNAN